MELLNIKNVYTIASDDHNKKILNGLDLTINEGEIHVIMGPNGGGKSTLANTIFNSYRYIKTDGSIFFNGEDITNKSTDEIARLGLFMSFQNPIELTGVSETNFLKAIKNKTSGEHQDIFTLQKEIKGKMDDLNINYDYLKREFNVGFSGGEKKKNEILQMMLLNPKLVILDETDSGLDVDAIKTVVKGINLYKNDRNAVLIITHSTKILEGLNVNQVHVLVNGKIVKSGDASLAYQIEKEGYQAYLNEN